MKDYDDKDLVLMSVLIICVATIAIPYCTIEAIGFAEKALYGLFGIAVGRATKEV
ncbi:hypothetical protein KA005_39580 [bacterium]|nr:hypothetical protein [bacterium]